MHEPTPEPPMPKTTYDAILKSRPPVGKAQDGEVEIVTAYGDKSDDGPFGVLYQDRWVTLVRDPVMFPNYTPGGHIRLFEGDPERRISGVVLLALRPSGDGGFEVAFVRQWRHALQAWATELPRGWVTGSEKAAQGALRELREETGLRNPDLFIHMGDMASNSGYSASVNSYYAAICLGHPRVVQREKNETEAISNVIWVPFERWRDVVSQPATAGRPVAPLDLFTAGAFGLAYMAGHLDRLKKATAAMFMRELGTDTRISADLQRVVRDGTTACDVGIHVASEATIRHLIRELPLIRSHEMEPLTFRLESVNALTLCWIAALPGVMSVDKL
jgi:ADP-ribose pyrophosphatase